MKKIIVLIIFIFLSINIGFANDISELKYDKKPEIKVTKDGIIVLGIKDGKSFVSKNGIKGKFYNGGIEEFIVSEEGNFSYIGTIDGKNNIIENGKELNICKNTDTFSLNFYNGKLLVSCYKSYLLENNFSIGNMEKKKEIHQYYYNGKKISSKDYSNFIKKIEEKRKQKKENIKNNCRFTKSTKREKDGFYHIFKDGKSIRKFKYSNQKIYCYNNGNNIFYLLGNKPKYASSKDSNYDIPDTTVIYTLITDNKEYKTKLDNIEFFKNGKNTAFILKNLNYEDELYVNGKLIKNLGKNSWINNFLFSPIGNNYMFTYIENQNKTYLYENGKEIFNKEGFGKIKFNYFLNGDSYYITKFNKIINGKSISYKDFLYKNGKKIIEKDEIQFISNDIILITSNKKILKGRFYEYKNEYYVYDLKKLGKKVSKTKLNPRERLMVIKSIGETYKKYYKNKKLKSLITKYKSGFFSKNENISLIIIKKINKIITKDIKKYNSRINLPTKKEISKTAKLKAVMYIIGDLHKNSVDIQVELNRMEVFLNSF